MSNLSKYIQAPAPASGGGDRAAAEIPKTGQLIEYRAGDDGAFKAGRATDFFTLSDTIADITGSSNPNYIGNFNKFTDELGLQTYANGIVIDWSTYNDVNALGIDRNSIGPLNWNQSITQSLTHSVGTFTTGWRLPNVNEFFNFANHGLISVYNYFPLNIALIASDFIWTSTTYKTTPGRALYCGNNAVILNLIKSSARAAFPVRNFTNADLGV